MAKSFAEIVIRNTVDSMFNTNENMNFIPQGGLLIYSQFVMLGIVIDKILPNTLDFLCGMV